MNIDDLLEACKKGDAKTVLAEIDRGFNVNAKGSMEYPASWIHRHGLMIIDVTPVQVALSFGHFDLAQQLIKRGANLKHVTQDGYDAAHLVGYTWPENAMDILGWLYYKHGFDFKTKDKKGYDVRDAVKGSVHPSLDFEKSQIKFRDDAMDMFTVADRIKRYDAGLCDAIKFDGDICGYFKESCDYKPLQLILVKLLVEHCGHTGINEHIMLQGFSGMRKEYNDMSAYEYAKKKGELHLVEYFDKFLGKKTYKDDIKQQTQSVTSIGQFAKSSPSKQDEVDKISTPGLARESKD